ncbi:Gravitropic in the light [Thalictrum thalictroides]|uniref:Gravitropic in the light n=1 Tax=Thalictrum thalictroides TaxID=46969 RepID=A0A7J6VHT3_THATH|nr:Gravitropic in the light [Thalictrum thalictroides]
MEPIKSSSAPNFNKMVRILSKVLRFRTSLNKTRKIKFHEKFKDGSNSISGVQQFPQNDDENNEKMKIMKEEAMYAVVAKLFASISTIKAAYAQLQLAQSPYNPDEIQVSDELVVRELKILSEVKQCYLKKQIDQSPQVTVLLAELKEQKSVIKSFEIMSKKLDSQFRLKDSEILFLKEKLEESDKQNELIEKKIDPFGSMSVLDSLQLSELNGKHFEIVLEHCIEVIRSFVKLIVSKMSSSGWDLDVAARSIEPGMDYGKVNEVHYVFESFVCREMFEGFQYPQFSTSNERQQRRRQCGYYFERFMELKSTNVMEMLKMKPGCSFGKFCRVKYLGLVHPKMELAFFGDMNQRNIVNSGEYPETTFFIAFAEMAKHVWLLHCLAFSFNPEINIFQVRRGSRFSEVFMENVVEDDIDDPTVVEPRVGFMVIPGFKIGKTVIQCQVYLSSA